jgi:hypothetical protein
MKYHLQQTLIARTIHSIPNLLKQEILSWIDPHISVNTSLLLFVRTAHLAKDFQAVSSEVTNHPSSIVNGEFHFCITHA